MSQPIIVTQHYPKDPTTVWRAITEVDQMTRWFFPDIPEFRAVVGFETKFGVDADGRVFEHVWKVTRVQPESLISYGWRYEGYSGDSQVTFELEETEQGTRLTLTHVGVETFPGDVPEFAREACVGGWNYFLKESLTGYLGG